MMTLMIWRGNGIARWVWRHDDRSMFEPSGQAGCMLKAGILLMIENRVLQNQTEDALYIGKMLLVAAEITVLMDDLPNPCFRLYNHTLLQRPRNSIYGNSTLMG